MTILGKSTITEIESCNKATITEVNTTTLNATTVTMDNLAFGTEGDAKAVLLDLIYPVGSIYVYQDGNSAPSTCPVANTLGGTWEKIEDRFLYSSSSPAKYGLRGGSAKGYLIDHDHQVSLPTSDLTLETDEAGLHKHPILVNKNWWHTGEGNKDRNYNIDGFDIDWEWGTYVPENGYYGNAEGLMSAAGKHKHTIPVPSDKFQGTSQKVKDQPSNTTKITNNTGVAEANMPPYFGVIAWRRTA